MKREGIDSSPKSVATFCLGAPEVQKQTEAMTDHSAVRQAGWDGYRTERQASCHRAAPRAHWESTAAKCYQGWRGEGREEGFVTAPRSISPQPNFAESDGRMKSSIIAQGELKAPRKGRRMEGEKNGQLRAFLSACHSWVYGRSGIAQKWSLNFKQAERGGPQALCEDFRRWQGEREGKRERKRCLDWMWSSEGHS